MAGAGWGWPGLGRVATGSCLGAIMALGQAPLGWWWLSVPALAALIWLVVQADNARSAAWTALFAGAGYFGLALSWIVEPFLIDVARHGWMAPFAVVMLAFGLALFWAGAGALAGRLGGRARRAIGFAILLAFMDLARGYVLTGFPWALVGHVWIDTPLAQLAAVIGPSGLTLLTALAAALPVALHWRGLALGLALLALTTGYGIWRLGAEDPAARGVTLRLVQPNAEQQSKWDPDQARILFDRMLEFTATAPRPDLVIWPETAVPYLMENNPSVAEAIAVAASGATVVVGAQRVTGDEARNSLLVLGREGETLALYDKHHLVPFGEYIPYGNQLYDWFGVRAFAARLGNGYAAGPGPQVIDLGGALGSFVPLICYEAVFPQDLRGLEKRPDWILQITNDAWFGTLTGPYQHLAQARLRAIEQGLPLVRVANTGVSALVDAKGRLLAEIPLGRAAFLDVQLPGALPAPLYARWGEAPLLVLLAGLGLWLLASRKTASA